jgi:hypothetical protein
MLIYSKGISWMEMEIIVWADGMGIERTEEHCRAYFRKSVPPTQPPTESTPQQNRKKRNQRQSLQWAWAWAWNSKAPAPRLLLLCWKG